MNQKSSLMTASGQMTYKTEYFSKCSLPNCLIVYISPSIWRCKNSRPRFGISYVNCYYVVNVMIPNKDVYRDTLKDNL